MLGIAKAVSNGNIKLMSTTTITSTGSQSYIVPGGTLYLEIEMWGAGGGGGLGLKSGGRGGTTYQEGAGGGGGAYTKHKYYPSNILTNDTINFTIGAGGDGADLSGGNECKGDAGGNTYVQTHKRSSTTITTFGITAGGGCGGDSGNVMCIGSYCFSDGGTAGGGNVTNTDGADGTDHGSASGSASDGKVGGAGANGGAGGAGGDASGSGNASNGTAPGGGGGGGAGHCAACPTSEEGGNGGNGANGQVIIKAYGIG